MTNNKRILLIDSYDSFTLNLSTLIRNVIEAEVVTIHSDSVAPEVLINRYLPLFDAVVIGPGPGSPDNPADVGVLPNLWKLAEDQVLPIFGVCLGFQSLVLAFGGQIERLPEPKHGQVDYIRHSGNDIFEGLSEPVESVRYHSLHATMPTAALAKENPIVALGWTTDVLGDATTEILMAGKHQTLPFWGVQYHPESICSKHGDTVLKNFWDLASQWLCDHNRVSKADPLVFQELLHLHSIKPEPFPRNTPASPSQKGVVNFESVDYTVSTSQLAVDICEELTNQKQHFTLLNSAAHPGRWSIIGLIDPGSTTCITHYIGKPESVYVNKYQSAPSEIKLDSSGIWGYLSRYMAPKIKAFSNVQNTIDASFCGGLVGYFSYEVAQHKNPTSILKPITRQDEPYPDVNLVDIERMILLDSETNKAYAVSLIDERGSQWFKDILQIVHSTLAAPTSKLDIPPSCCEYFGGEKPTVEFPNKETYLARILESQEELRAGNSYELCLTAQTKITMPAPQGRMSPWDLYKVLFKRNPAPYSCMMDFEGATLVGSSPERFMSWNRQGVCEFRPIKGTVKKGPEVTTESASAILNSPKERAENLMIVDLIRHDLNTLLSNVRMDKLMGVEEYETVYQLVSVIRGDLEISHSDDDDGDRASEYSGFDVLVHSLPPGSMTGAPKIRSVEILHDLEAHEPRGIYSGVSGYWSVFDEGDWSVVIRSAFKYSGEQKKASAANSGSIGGDIWRIGAGGAITILSDPEDEWEEMSIKLTSALQAFV